MPDADTIFRDFKRFTGDGLPGEPAGAPLPTGDPASGQHNVSKKDIRDWANESDAIMQGVLADAQDAADRAEAAAAAYPIPAFSIGATDNAPAINAALLSGNNIIIPRGEWMLGSALLLPSNSSLTLAPGAILRHSDGVYDNIIRNRNARALLQAEAVFAFTGSSLSDPLGTVYEITGGDGKGFYYYEKIAAPSDVMDPETWISPLITAAGCWVKPMIETNLHVIGHPGSMIDCNAPGKDRVGSAWSDVGAHALRGVLMCGVENYSFCGNELRNSASFAMHHEGVSDFKVNGNRILQLTHAQDSLGNNLTFSNQDGIDVRQGCRNFEIMDNFIISSDDSIACTTLKARNLTSVYGAWDRTDQVPGVSDGNAAYNPTGHISYRWDRGYGYDIRNFKIGNNVCIARGTHHAVRLTCDSGRQISGFDIFGIHDRVMRDDVLDEAFAEYLGRKQIDAVVLLGDSDYWYGDSGFAEIEGQPSLDPEDIRNGRVYDCSGYANMIVRCNAPSQDIKFARLRTVINADSVGYDPDTEGDDRNDQRLVGYYHTKGGTALGGAYTGTTIKYLGHSFDECSMAHDIPTGGDLNDAGEFLFISRLGGPIEVDVTFDRCEVKNAETIASFGVNLENSAIHFSRFHVRKEGGLGDYPFSVEAGFDWADLDMSFVDPVDADNRNYNLEAADPADVGAFYESIYGMKFDRACPEVQDNDIIPSAAGGSTLRFAAGVLGPSAATASRRSGAWIVQETSRGAFEANLRVAYSSLSGATPLLLTSTMGYSAVPSGLEIRFRADFANSGGIGINLDDTGAVACRTVRGGATALPANYIRTDMDTVARYDGTNWIVDRAPEIIDGNDGQDYRIVKYADGRMIIAGAFTMTNAAATAEGSQFVSSTVTHTFPEAFASFARGKVEMGDPSVHRDVRITNLTSLVVESWSNATDASTTDVVPYSAEGFWY